MADEHKKGLNTERIWKDLQNCCMEQSVCSQCQSEKCIIGYAKKCIKNFEKEPKKEIPGGTKQIPMTDYKAFDEMELEIAIAHILKECKDCKEDHVEDCIINVIRNCFEMGLFDKTLPYEGSALQYLVSLKSDFPEKSIQIADSYLK